MAAKSSVWANLCPVTTRILAWVFVANCVHYRLQSKGFFFFFCECPLKIRDLWCVMLMQPCCYTVWKVFWNILDLLHVFPSRIIDSLAQHGSVVFSLNPLVTGETLSGDSMFFVFSKKIYFWDGQDAVAVRNRYLSTPYRL